MFGSQWVLVFISISSTGVPEIHKLGQFQRLSHCFAERDRILSESGSTNGYFPIGKQALCVQARIED